MRMLAVWGCSGTLLTSTTVHKLYVGSSSSEDDDTSSEEGAQGPRATTMEDTARNTVKCE